MEWMVINPIAVHNTFALGAQVGDSYIANEDCLAILGEIIEKLLSEDKMTRKYRRTLGFSQVIKKDLLPLLINTKDNFKVLDATVRILVNLTQPIECLLPVELMCKTDAGRITVFEINHLLVAGKEAFTDARCTRCVVEHMKFFLEKEGELSADECESINNCLLLLRNMLHIPQWWGGCGQSDGLQNQIIWNLFSHSIDKVIIHLITGHHKSSWAVTMVQLIALIYKDQQVGLLQKLLSQWFEASLSDSSEDNESNTSSRGQRSVGSSPVMMSDPTSDSSDNGGSTEKMNTHASRNNETDFKRKEKKYSHSVSGKDGGKGSQLEQSTAPHPARRKERPSIDSGQSSLHSPTSSKDASNLPSCSWDMPECEKMSSDLVDGGYVTQAENQESMSVSSNEGYAPNFKRPVHQKKHMVQKSRRNTSKATSLQDKKELRRKKLVKRSKTTMVNVKALVHHVPTDEDIFHLLKEFTVDFMLKGYSCLVRELHRQLLGNVSQTQLIDTSHFFWLVTYFLRFAAQLELDFKHVSAVLSFDILTYLIYEGAHVCEQLESASQHPGQDTKSYLRRMHLVVTAIREFLERVDAFKKMSCLSPGSREHLQQLQLKVATTEDLKGLFVLLLCQFKPGVHSKQFLQDVIMTNHVLLLFLDDAYKMPEYDGSASMVKHIELFASADVMHKYGLLLEKFQDNGQFINDCIFTMMHHIGGNLKQIPTLFQPGILKTFSQIWETDFEVCDDWSDLIVYVINKFVNTPQQTKVPAGDICMPSESRELSSVPVDNGEAEWSKEDLDNLSWFYFQNSESKDPIGKVVQLFAEDSITKSRADVANKLLVQKVISPDQHDRFVKMETVGPGPVVRKLVSPVRMEDSPASVHNGNGISSPASDDTKVMLDGLQADGMGDSVAWLQGLLLETCYVKLCAGASGPAEGGAVMEPIPLVHALLKQSIPVVPWSCRQRAAMQHKPFVVLLRKLGFHLPADSGKVFARIPDFWTADVVYAVAEKLGCIDTAAVKFDTKLLRGLERCASAEDTMVVEPSSSRDTTTFTMPRPKQMPISMVRFAPKPYSVPNWLQLVAKTKQVASNVKPIA